MTDNEIIKEATESYEQDLDAGCYVGDLLRIINRLEADVMAKEMEYNDMLEQRNSVERCLETAKAEVERLKEENQEMDQAVLNTLRRVRKVRLDAYKEFAGRVKKEIIEAKYQYMDTPYTRACNQVADWCVNLCDNLLKEMVGE